MAGRHGKRRGGHDDHPEHIDERWVLTYADLITLLMALFMVLFSISSVNKSKYETLQRTLSEAFSGKIVSGGSSVLSSGTDDTAKKAKLDTALPQTQDTATGTNAAKTKAMAEAEDRGLRALQKRVEEIARQKGLGGKVQVRLNDSGLVIRVLTDDLLFDSGQATPEPQSLDLLSRIGHVLAEERSHSVLVEGHTDPVPVAGRYPTNWELSTARASSIVRSFERAGVSSKRLTASGRADLNPIAANTSAAGRKINRRVEILLPRKTVAPTTSPVTGASTPTTPEP